MTSYDELKKRRDARIAARRKPRKPVARKSRPKASKRTTAETRRQYGQKAFRDHLHASPCLWCGVTRPIEQAHLLGTGGMSKKKGWETTGPLCGSFTSGDYNYTGCHSRYDRRSSKRYWFDAVDRALIRLRHANFIADWLARHQGEVQ